MKIKKTPNDTRCDATGNLQSRTTYHCMDVGSRVTQEAKANDAMDYRIGRSGGSLGNRSYYLEGEHLESEYIGNSLQARYFRGTSTGELVAAWLLGSDGKTKAYLFHHDPVNSVSQVTATTAAQHKPLVTASLAKRNQLLDQCLAADDLQGGFCAFLV